MVSYGMCFFDPKSDRPMLYMIAEPWSVADFIVLHDGRIVYVPRHSGEGIVPNLRSGDYEVYIVGGTDTEEVGWQSVTFNIPEPGEQNDQSLPVGLVRVSDTYTDSTQY